MLAQNFKTAEELGLADDEHRALIKVLGMFEREEIPHHAPGSGLYDRNPAGPPVAFNMQHFFAEADCGTVACICGWAISIGKLDQHELVKKRLFNRGLKELFDPAWNLEKARNITPSQAALALRSYLTIGEARWDLAIAS